MQAARKVLRAFFCLKLKLVLQLECTSRACSINLYRYFYAHLSISTWYVRIYIHRQHHHQLKSPFVSFAEDANAITSPFVADFTRTLTPPFFRFEFVTTCDHAVVSTDAEATATAIETGVTRSMVPIFVFPSLSKMASPFLPAFLREPQHDSRSCRGIVVTRFIIDENRSYFFDVCSSPNA